MIVRRCQICRIDWPDEREYARCPKCETRTLHLRGDANARPLPAAKARSMRLHFEFDRYYARREKLREDREARELMQEISELQKPGRTTGRTDR